MASWQTHIQSRLGATLGSGNPIPETAEVIIYIQDAIQETRVRLMRVVPQEIPQFSKTATANDGNGIDAEDALAILSVTRMDGTANQEIPCTEIPSEMKYKVTDEDSLHFRSKHNPCYYQFQDKVFIKPDPASSNNTGTVTYVPAISTKSNGSSITIGSETNTTDNMPDKYIHLVVFHTMVQVLDTIMSNIHTEINSLLDDISVPDVPTIVYDNIEMPSLPTYKITPINLNYKKVESYFDSEDSELVGPAINQLTQQISEFNALSKEEQQRVQTQLKEYDGELQKRFKQADGDLQADIAEYQRRIEKYGQDIAKFGTDLQSWTTRYNWYAGQMQMYAQKYLAFFGQVAPQQRQQREEGERGER